MANVSSANSIYVDTQSNDVATATTYIIGVVLTPTAASAVMVLKDRTPGKNTKLDLRAADSGQSLHLDLTKSPLQFMEGIAVTTLTNAVATLIVSQTGRAS